jgi:hypothetical protein
MLDLKYSKFIKKKNRICISNGCNKQSSFNYKLKQKFLYCLNHKLNNMINVKHKTCKYDNCITLPSYGFEIKKPLYCKIHAENNMIDVINKKCKYDNCNLRPCYGIELQSPIYCKKHYENGMINVVSKQCKYSNCSKVPIYGLEYKIGLYCKEHACKNMRDVVNNKCNYLNCDIRATYGLEFKKASYCKEHKNKNMFNVMSKKCAFLNCKTMPNYGLKWQDPTHCKLHANKKMFDVNHKKCNLCKLFRCTNKYDNMCANCYYYTNPDTVLARNHKTKENQIIRDLNNELDNIIIQDKIILNGCSRRRPDGLIKLNDYNIIIEIDENQHSGADYSCENKRLMEIFQDLGNSPLTIIRFNPDAYKLENIAFKSPFGITKSDGKLKIINQKEYKYRFNKLLEIVKKNINSIPNKEFNVIQLFYSE